MTRPPSFWLCTAVFVIPAPASATASEVPRVLVGAALSDLPAQALPMQHRTVDLTATLTAAALLNLTEALAGVPGVFARDRHNAAQDVQLSARGFGARASFGVRGMRIVSDGIPATMPDGQSQVAHLDLALGGELAVLRGPFAAAQGNAAGGVILHRSAPPEPGPAAVASFGLGAAGYQRKHLRASLGGAWGSASLSTSRIDSAGWRQHSAFHREFADLRTGWRATPALDLRFQATRFEQPLAEDPLGLTRAQWRADPRQAGSGALAFDARKSLSHEQAGLAATQKLGAGGTAQFALWHGERTLTQFLAIPRAAQAAASHGGGVVDLERDFGGAEVRWQQDWHGALGRVTLRVGAAQETMDETRRGYENFDGTRLGVRGRQRRDEDNRVENTALFAQADWETPWAVALLVGQRASQVHFESRDHYLAPGNPDDSGSRRYGASTPTLGVSWRPTPNWHLFYAVGRGFETPTAAELAYRIDGGAGFNDGLRAATSHHRELGGGWREGDARLELVRFAVDTRDEIVAASSVAGRTSFRNVGRTERAGWELQASRVWPQVGGAKMTLDFSLATLAARFSDGTLANRRLPGTPPQQIALTWRWIAADESWHIGAEGRAAGPSWVNDANSERAPGQAVIDLHLRWQQRSAGWRWRQSLRVENLFDRRYVGSLIVNEAQGRYYEPAPGRRALVTFELARHW